MSRAATLTIAAVCVAVITLTVAACGGGRDGPASFLSEDDTSAIYVEWTRTGDDLSGSLSTAEVTQPQAQPGIFSTAPPPGQIRRQSAAFTGTVRDDSVRLLLGSGTHTNRVNGRLDGDTLELTVPQDEGVLTRRREPADDGDFTKATRQISDREQQRQAAAKAVQERKRRTDRIEITRVATAFQSSLEPGQPRRPVPLRHVRGQAQRTRLRRSVDATAMHNGGPRQRRRAERACVEGTAGRRRDQVRSATATDGQVETGPDGAVVTWRPKPDPDSLGEDSRRTMFIEQNGRWLVYRCCP